MIGCRGKKRGEWRGRSVEHRTKDREAYKGSIPWVRREEREVGRSSGGKDGWELVFEWEEDAATRG
jgi:hypothetical protein